MSAGDHQAAVRALAWSPHHSGLLASGAGTADRRIRFWNALSLQPLHAIDTGSQVTMSFAQRRHHTHVLCRCATSLGVLW